jgi:periplasmic protein TonB
MPRHNSVVVISVLSHVAAIAMYVLLSILAPDLLPIPPIIAEGRTVTLMDIPLPPKPPTPRPLTPAPQTTVSANAAPLVAQEGIREETGHEQVRPETYEPGVVNGDPAAVSLSVVEAPAPPPAPARTEPVRLHSGMTAPRKVADALPVYPPIAQASRTSGIVIVEVVISDTGEVTSARILRSIPLLDAAALDAVRKWRFEPARLNGEAIPIVMTVTVNFQLNR